MSHPDTESELPRRFRGVADLCLEPVAARDAREFMGSCIRIVGHRGEHRRIHNGMSAAQAEAITRADVEYLGWSDGGQP